MFVFLCLEGLDRYYWYRYRSVMNVHKCIDLFHFQEAVFKKHFFNVDPVFVSGSCHKRTGSAALRACLLLIILCSIIKVPPPSLGIRVIGVNMIHGVPDKLNIYVKRVLEGSVAGLDGRIKTNDHIVEVRRG